MKAVLAVGVVALAGLQGCNPGGGGPQCGTQSAQHSPLLIYVGGDTGYSKETDVPPARQALRRGEIPVRPAAWTKDTYPKPFLKCLTIYAGPLPK
jgi:hypothetical protein